MVGTQAGQERAGRVQRLAQCDLRVASSAWRWAEAHATAIDAHWARRQAESPAMFNGALFVMAQSSIAAGRLAGVLTRTEFKAMLYWKEHGYPDLSVRDVFGSALLYTAEGYVVLGRRAAGHLNSGLAYLPGGFIDPRDVGPDGHVALDASVARELAEETGLDARDMDRLPGYVMTEAGALVSLAVPLRSRLPAEALVAQVRAHIAAEDAPELADVVLVREPADVSAIAMPDYARVLLATLFAAK